MIFLPQIPRVAEDAKVAAARRALKDFDVQGPYRLRWSGDGPYFGRIATRVDLSNAWFTYHVEVGPNRRVLSIQRSDDLFQTAPVPTPGDEAKAKRWIERDEPRLPIRPKPRTRFDDPTDFFYQGLVRGYPLLYPQNRLDYRVRLKAGKLFAFEAWEDAPPVGPSVPRVTEREALAIVDRIFKRDVLAPAIRNGNTAGYTLGPRELGWAIPEGASVARLVWRVPARGLYHGAYAVQPCAAGGLIDAITGEPVTTKASI